MPSDRRVSIVMVPEGYPHIIRTMECRIFYKCRILFTKPSFINTSNCISKWVTVSNFTVSNFEQYRYWLFFLKYATLCWCVWYLCRINWICRILLSTLSKLKPVYKCCWHNDNSCQRRVLIMCWYPWSISVWGN